MYIKIVQGTKSRGTTKQHCRRPHIGMATPGNASFNWKFRPQISTSRRGTGASV